jgi:tetratricopeptide (TPR) repeat protein
MSLAAGLSAAGPTVTERWEAGHHAYEQGRYTEARDAYESVVSEGYGGADLAYDLGNTYYRLGRTGKARLWYERARREAPADEDVRHNLELLRRHIEDDPGEETPWEGLTAFWPFLLALLFAANAAFFAFLTLGLFRSDEWLWWARWSAAAVLTVAAALTAVSASQRPPREGVVMDARVEARTGPGPGYRVAFVAPEGQKVSVLETRNGWTQVGLTDKGLKGWVTAASLEDI